MWWLKTIVEVVKVIFLKNLFLTMRLKMMGEWLVKMTRLCYWFTENGH
jgi:hypothetical protein